MEFGDFDYGFDSSSPSSPSGRFLCRICHEEEDENSTTMESPCACSGTLKFAHRDCIQRWCDEKGSTVCEICLQKFEPGFIVPPKLALLDIAVTIRGSLEVPRVNYEGDEEQVLLEDESYNDCPLRTSTSNRFATWFRHIPLILMLVLLARHFMVVMRAEEEYPLARTTIFLLRACGILLPYYCILKIVSAIQRGQQEYQRHWFHLHRRVAATTEENEELPQLTIQIQS